MKRWTVYSSIWSPRRRASPTRCERLEHDAVQVDVGAAVAGELLLAPGGGEALREVGGGDQLDAGRAQQLGGAGVEARDRWAARCSGCTGRPAARQPATSCASSSRCFCQVR